MPKITGNYEAAMILNANLGEEGTKAIIEKISSLIAENGTLEGVEEWGKKKLAYEINDETEGYYVFFNFQSKTDFPAELNRISNITDGILRSLVIAKEA